MAKYKNTDSKKFAKAFADNVLKQVREAEVNSLTTASYIFMPELVRQAQFNDFTGSLNASYAAAIYHNGKYVRKTADSKEFADTAPIRARRGQWVAMRNRRVSANAKTTGMHTKTTHYGNGFANRMEKLRARSPKAEYAVIMTNTAPYAEEVHRESDRRVMPSSSSKYAGTFLRILKSNLKTKR